MAPAARIFVPAEAAANPPIPQKSSKARITIIRSTHIHNYWGHHDANSRQGKKDASLWLVQSLAGVGLAGRSLAVDNRLAA